MDVSQVLQWILTLAVGVGGFFFKRFSDALDEGSRRMSKLEKEIVRQKQQADDLHDRLDRIEDKIDRLLER